MLQKKRVDKEIETRKDPTLTLPEKTKNMRQKFKLLGMVGKACNDKFMDADDDCKLFLRSNDRGEIIGDVIDKKNDGYMWFNSNDRKYRTAALTRPGSKVVTPQKFFCYNKGKIDKFKKFAKELNDINNGKTHYVKGKGWQ